MTALLGVGTVVLIGLLGRRIAGDRAGLIAALLAAVSPPLWSNDSVLGLETLFCFLVVLSLLAVYRFWAAPGMGAAALVAIPLSLGALTRSEGVILLVLIGGLTALLAPGWEWRRKLQALGVIAGISIVIISPWVVRNLTTFEEPTVLGTGFGLVANYGNCDATYGGPMLGYWSDDCVTEEYTPDQEESVYDRRRLEEGHEYVEDHLDRVPVVVLARAGRIWEAFRPTQNVELNEFFEQRGDQMSWAVLISYYVLLPFAVRRLGRHATAAHADLPDARDRGRDHTHRGDRLSRHALPRVVRHGGSSARRGRSRRVVASLARRQRVGVRPRPHRATTPLPTAPPAAEVLG